MTERIVWGVGTPRTFRVHWALHELGLSYETQPIGSRTGETQSDSYRALNPREKIPTYCEDGLVMVESAAIVTHLAESNAEPSLIPPLGTRQRSQYFEWCFFVMTELDAHSLYVIRRHGDLSQLYGEAPAAIQAAREYFEKHAGVANAHFADGRPFVCGDQFTGADILLNSVLTWGAFLSLRVGDRLLEFVDRTGSRPAFRAAFAVNFPGGPGPKPA
jgi:glutathione S-transferase